jgi:hypothetical protein
VQANVAWSGLHQLEDAPRKLRAPTSSEDQPALEAGLPFSPLNSVA